MAWTNEKVRILTEMFEKQDILYNVCGKDYRNEINKKQCL